jgi:hypothetical protein
VIKLIPIGFSGGEVRDGVLIKIFKSVTFSKIEKNLDKLMHGWGFEKWLTKLKKKKKKKQVLFSYFA